MQIKIERKIELGGFGYFRETRSSSYPIFISFDAQILLNFDEKAETEKSGNFRYNGLFTPIFKIIQSQFISKVIQLGPGKLKVRKTDKSKTYSACWYRFSFSKSFRSLFLIS